MVAVAAGRPLRGVWENEIGGLTFAVDGPAGPEYYVKWAPPGSELDYALEAARLAWAAPFTPVPEVLELGRDGDGSWMLMRALPGRSAAEGRWVAEPAVAVRAIGEGLRALHHALPTESCPFSWSADERVALACRRAAAGLQHPAKWHEQHRHLSI